MVARLRWVGLDHGHSRKSTTHHELLRDMLRVPLFPSAARLESLASLNQMRKRKRGCGDCVEVG